MSERKFLNKLPDPGREVESYQARLRQAMFDGVGDADIREIVSGIVQRAKQGSQKDIAFVFEYLIGSPTKAAPQSATQINVYQEPPKGKPTKAIRGSKAKVETMARRAANGEAIFHSEDSDPE